MAMADTAGRVFTYLPQHRRLILGAIRDGRPVWAIRDRFPQQWAACVEDGFIETTGGEVAHLTAEGEVELVRLALMKP